MSAKTTYCGAAEPGRASSNFPTWGFSSLAHAVMQSVFLSGFISTKTRGHAPRMVLIPMLLCTAFMVPPDLVKLGITCAAGATGALCFYPLDLLKTRLQSSTGAQEFGNSFDAAMQVASHTRGVPLLPPC